MVSERRVETRRVNPSLQSGIEGTVEPLEDLELFVCVCRGSSDRHVRQRIMSGLFVH